MVCPLECLIKWVLLRQADQFGFKREKEEMFLQRAT